jgi:hypothetical protein
MRLDNVTAANVLATVSNYVHKYSGPQSEAPLNPEAREETVSRIAFDVITGPDPEGDVPLVRHVFRWCRLWRVRGWHGNTAADQADQRFRRRLRKAREDGRGFGPMQGAWDDCPSNGASVDARLASPDRIVSAREEASGELVLSADAFATRKRRGLPVRLRGGCRYIPDRVKRSRRKTVPLGGKGGRKRSWRIVVVPVSRITYGGCPATGIEFRKVCVGETGPSHKGSLANRDVESSRTVSVPSDTCRYAHDAGMAGPIYSGPADIPKPVSGASIQRPADPDTIGGLACGDMLGRNGVLRLRG